jgi:hypothetical protein
MKGSLERKLAKKKTGGKYIRSSIFIFLLPKSISKRMMWKNKKI